MNLWYRSQEKHEKDLIKIEQDKAFAQVRKEEDLEQEKKTHDILDILTEGIHNNLPILGYPDRIISCFKITFLVGDYFNRKLIDYSNYKMWTDFRGIPIVNEQEEYCKFIQLQYGNKLIDLQENK